MQYLYIHFILLFLYSQATMTSDKWKLIWGQEYLLKQTQPLQSQNTQLYNIMEDPNEIYNQDMNFPEVYQEHKFIILIYFYRLSFDFKMKF